MKRLWLVLGILLITVISIACFTMDHPWAFLKPARNALHKEGWTLNNPHGFAHKAGKGFRLVVINIEDR